ncbi:hypothetical protein [Kutzneria kofuensis]|uniref:hypothetical protein n=1 Tax=Kutzneria kofuensis TaxID=103725 RepID=UPI0031E88AC2
MRERNADHDREQMAQEALRRGQEASARRQAEPQDENPEPIPPGPARPLDAVLPKKDWWKLYLDPAHHEEALRRFPDDPGSMYDHEQSKGFQRSMESAYERYLNDIDPNERFDSAKYKQMHDAVTAHLGKTYKWSGSIGRSGTAKNTHFPIGDRPLARDISTRGWATDAWCPRWPRWSTTSTTSRRPRSPATWSARTRRSPPTTRRSTPRS